jgi:hypothetical protein
LDRTRAYAELTADLERFRRMPLSEAVWQNLDPISHTSRVTCPFDGSSLQTRVMPHHGPERFYLWAHCTHPGCRRMLAITEMSDLRADRYRGREWSALEQADMVQRALTGEIIQRCPVDAVPIRVAQFRDEDEAIVVVRLRNEWRRSFSAWGYPA